MSEQWYLLVGDREYGPFTSQQLSEFVQQGRLIRENFVRTATSPQWIAASQIPGLFPAASPPMAAQEMPLARPAPPPGFGGAPAPAVARQEVPLAGVFRPPVPAISPAPMAPVAAPAPAVPRQEVPLAGVYRPPTPAVPTPRPASPVASGPSVPMVPTGPTATGATISSRTPQAYSAPSPQLPTRPAVPPTPAMPAPAPAIHTPGAWSPPARAQTPVMPGPQTMAVPTAMPVAQGVAVSQGYPQPLPVGAPAGTPPLGTIPTANGSGVAGSGSQYTERTELARKRAKANSQQLMMIFGGVGAGVAILLLIVVVAIVKGTRKAQEQPTATAVKKPKPKSKTDGQASHGHDAGTVNGPPLPAPVINTWLNAAKDRVGLKGVLRMYVSSAWFENSGQQRRVKVAVRLTNSAGKGMLDYHPWPAHVLPSDPFTAVMTDDRGTRLTPLASGMTARTVHQLKPGQVVTEQLAFDMPPYEVARLRLALPMAAFGHSGHIGFEIPRAMIQAQEPVPTLDIGFERPSPLPNVTDTTPGNELDASILGVREVHTTPLRASDLPVGLPKSNVGEVQKDKADLQNQLDQAKPVEPPMEKPLEKEKDKEKDEDMDKKPADAAPAEK